MVLSDIISSNFFAVSLTFIVLESCTEFVLCIHYVVLFSCLIVLYEEKHEHILGRRLNNATGKSVASDHSFIDILIMLCLAVLFIDWCLRTLFLNY